MDKFLLADLMDFYAPLLTDRQREMLSLYVAEDLSYGEIALEKGISRQAAADSAKIAGEQLMEFERKLGMHKLHRELSKLVTELSATLQNADLPLAQEITTKLQRLIDEEDENAL